MSKERPVIRKLVYLESSEDDDEDEIDPLDLPPLKSCLAPIITVPASEDKSEPEDGSIPTLETDLSLDDDRINIPGAEGRGYSLMDHVDHVDEACPQPFNEWALTPPHLPSIWDPPEHHGTQLPEFPHNTREEILEVLFLQVQRMMRYLEEQR